MLQSREISMFGKSYTRRHVGILTWQERPHRARQPRVEVAATRCKTYQLVVWVCETLFLRTPLFGPEIILLAILLLPDRSLVAPYKSCYDSAHQSFV
jgi:hypothetical protein